MQCDSTATRLKVLADREDEWNLRMEMVKGARRFLLLTSYYFAGDGRGCEMADALTVAARRGVRVVLVVDGFGQRLSANLSTAAERARQKDRLRAIQRAGGLVVSYVPRGWARRFVGGGLHVKIQVSEAGVALFGSSNIGHHSFDQWNEVSLEMEGAIVRDLLCEACTFAALSEQQSAALRALLPAPSPSGRTFAVRYVREDPADRSGVLFPFAATRNRLTDELVGFIERAQRSVSITSLYYRPTPALSDAILRACRRGLDVEIFHSHRDSLGVTHVPWISASIQYRSLLEAGARIYENRAGEHSKILLVDERAVAVGSYNLEHAAHDRLVEAMVFSDDEALCARFGALFQQLRSSPNNTKLEARWLNDLPAALRVKRWLYRPLQRWV